MYHLVQPLKKKPIPNDTYKNTRQKWSSKIRSENPQEAWKNKTEQIENRKISWKT